MKTRHSMSEIRSVLETEIAGALNVAYFITHVEIPEIDSSNQGYFAKGSFRVTPLFETRTGSFEAKLDENLNLLSLKIKEE